MEQHDKLSDENKKGELLMTYHLQFVLVSFAVQLKRKAIHGRHASVLSLFFIEEVQKHQCTVVGGIIIVQLRQETGSLWWLL